MMQKKILIILGTAFKKRLLTPRPLLQARLDYGVEQWEEFNYERIIVSGGKTLRYRKRQLPSEAEIMKRYLVKKGIPARKIIKEQQARNTIGNLAYTKRILERKGWKKIYIITNTIFVQRVDYLANQIYERSYKVRILGCANRMRKNFRRWIHFSESFWLGYCYAFFFKGVKRGDYREVIRRLKDKEHYYPPEYRDDYRELEQKYFRLYRRKVQ